MEITNKIKDLVIQIKEHLGKCDYFYDRTDYIAKVIYFDDSYFEKFLKEKVFVDNTIIEEEYLDCLKKKDGEELLRVKQYIYDEIEGYVFNYYTRDDNDSNRLILSTKYKEEKYNNNPTLFFHDFQQEFEGKKNLKLVNFSSVSLSEIYGDDFDAFLNMIETLPTSVVSIGLSSYSIGALIGKELGKIKLLFSKLPKNIKNIDNLKDLLLNIPNSNQEVIQVLSYLPKSIKILSLEYIGLGEIFKDESKLTLPEQLKLLDLSNNDFSNLGSVTEFEKIISNLPERLDYLDISGSSLGILYEGNIDKLPQLAKVLPRNLKIIKFYDGDKGGVMSDLGFTIMQEGNSDILQKFFLNLPKGLLNFNFLNLFRTELFTKESFNKIINNFPEVLTQTSLITFSRPLGLPFTSLLSSENEFNYVLEKIPGDISQLKFIEIELGSIFTDKSRVTLDLSRFKKLKSLQINDQVIFQNNPELFIEFIKLLPDNLEELFYMVRIEETIKEKSDFFKVISFLPKNLKKLRFSPFSNTLNDLLKTADDIELMFDKLPKKIEDISVEIFLDCYSFEPERFIYLLNNFGSKIAYCGNDTFVKVFTEKPDLYTKFVLDNIYKKNWKFEESFLRFIGYVFKGNPEKLIDFVKQLPEGCYLQFEKEGGMFKVFGRKKKLKEEFLNEAKKRNIEIY